MAKNYCGNGWQNDKFPDMVNITVNLEKLKSMPVNSYGDVKLTVSKMKQPSEKTKATHTVYENDYQPQGGQSREPDASPKGDDDLPF